ncbi:MAG TPA: DUF2312 domain-containing protein [Sphingomonas sp.]|jgi:uncharacterized protein (UPF0335 family)
MSDIGHNGEGTVASDEVRLLVERIERLTEEKKGIADDMKDVKAEAKSRGYDPKMIVFLVRERAKAKDKRDEERALQETYLAAMGML